MKIQTQIIVALLCTFSISGCSHLEKNAFKETVLGIGDLEAKNEENFQKIPFEKIVHKAFQTGMFLDKMSFSAVYKGTIPDPKMPIEDFITLKLCDVKQSSLCSEEFYMKNWKAEKTIFSLKTNQKVEVFGTLNEIDGVTLVSPLGGSHEIYIGDHSVREKYRFFDVFKIRPSNNNEVTTGSEQSDKPKSTSTQSESSERVKKAQQLLKDAGYDPGTIDGVFGKKTKNAILEYQRDFNLKATGRLDKATCESLDLE